ncbi:MAG: hypothetical protein LC656_06915 [Sphingomonadales bacterium]|nr:hypothetical protein [Sphingomonadales bacterium]
MTDGRWWLALVTFERCHVEQEILPDWAYGACGWQVALAPDEETAAELLILNTEHDGLRVLEVAKMREVYSEVEIAEIDDHLANNFRQFELGKRTVWGTIHCYKGEGEA